MYKPVRVIPYDDFAVAELEAPTMADKASHWLADNWQTLGLFGLAGFGVLFLRSMVKSAQTPPPTSMASHSDREAEVAALSAAEQEAAEESSEVMANSLKRKFQAGGRSLRDELTELVREDPDAAANVLKLWISDAA